MFKDQKNFFYYLGILTPLIFLILLILIFSSLHPRFLHPLNIFNVMRQISITGLIALGMTFVIIVRGIDLSVGSLIALCGLVGAVIAKGGLVERFSVGLDSDLANPWYWALAGSVLIGLLAGTLNGVCITKLKVPAFVVTLGGLSAYRGTALIVSDGGPISGFNEAYRWIGQDKIGMVPIPVIIFLVFIVLCHIILKYTVYGRYIYSVGGNPEAARLSGINIDLIITSTYIITGFFVGLSAFILSARLNSSEAVAGMGYELNVIAIVVVGGTSLFGGMGSILGTIIGAMLFGVLQNGLVLLNVSSYIQQIVIGIILILAVTFDKFSKSARQV
ncbi:MAG: ABC transporter permease [Candidatus Marinimicrobia bacterium]|nr:ABC transporter permease [Candidatus Neomarinimicrobiota bacterium]